MRLSSSVELPLCVCYMHRLWILRERSWDEVDVQSSLLQTSLILVLSLPTAAFFSLYALCLGLDEARIPLDVHVLMSKLYSWHLEEFY